jgi:hypothetical protein
MKRTLNDTARRVRIVISNNEQMADHPDIWSAGASIDGTIISYEVSGSSAQDVLAKMRIALEHGGELDDLPVPVPEKDKAVLLLLLQGIFSTWGTPADIPNWRENEYLRGQLELVIETCRVVTDQEWETGDAEGDMIRDRITDWITRQVWT